MKLNFSNILIKPLKQKGLFKNLILLFLPATLAGFSLGTDTWLFYTMNATALIALYGYLQEVMFDEIENDGESPPDWKFLQNFFTGIKALLFFFVNLALLFAVILALWLFIGNIPGFEIVTKILAIISFIYWFFMYYVVSIGLFVNKFNPIVALNVSTVMQIANGCLYNYFTAFIYVIIYAVLLVILYWMVIFMFGNNFLVIEMFIVYGITLHALLYSEVFKNIRDEFENYI